MSDFVEYLSEVFVEFGPITSRKMFGGYGIYHDGLMFGLVADDQLYLKVDAESKPAFVERGLEPFRFEMKGKVGEMSYHAAPEEIFDDPALARKWAVRGFEAALRAKKPKPRKNKQ